MRVNRLNVSKQNKQPYFLQGKITYLNTLRKTVFDEGHVMF